MTSFRHPEAFRLLRYRCAACGFVETVWNSRDGAAPNVIACAAVTFGQERHERRNLHALIALGFDPTELSRPCGVPAFLINWPGVSTYARGLADFAPIHDPLPGERYFRDGIPAEARAIMRARLELMRAGPDGDLIRDEDIRRLVRAAGGEEPYPDPHDPGAREFAPGWPMLVVRGTDADGLSVTRERLGEL